MPSPHLNLQSLHPANLKNIPAGLGNLVNERGFNQQVITGLMTNAKKLLEFLKQPKVRAVLLAAGVSFTAVFLFVAGLGFNLAGIGAGSLAAAFQSAFPPAAGGLFATLQSMGMLGTLLPVQIGVGGVSAAVVAVVWALGGGDG
ncbi:hypothetical protein IMSHALPRED_008800 [Imshaugia aleurites]|uniref:Uncharacterized protein n=1 Tax=Imshaugia aleurites TaxID=172621 RepID=A0A8H3FW13_9LECA|nr:hypothetical protein IMSHALPRED_008800 [Imshaugia aleurites]